MSDNLTVEIPSEVTGPVDPAVAAKAETAAQQTPAATEQPEADKAPENQEPEQKEGDKQETKAPETRDAAVAELNDKGLRIEDFEAEFTASGALSEDSYKKLMDAGIPRNMVDSYIAGQQALVQTFVNDIYAIAGGQEQYGEMIQWAAKSLSPSEIAAFDRIANAGQRDMLELAVTGLAARWKASEGHTPELAQGRASAGKGARDVFESPAQVVEAMKDKRYGTDSAYTSAVEQKMARSNVFGRK